MGIYFADQYSLLHFSTGVIIYFWNIPLWAWIVIHIGFEMIENTQMGMDFINQYIKFWPGGKSYADSVTNSIGDITFGVLGWLIGYYLNRIGEQQFP